MRKYFILIAGDQESHCGLVRYADSIVRERLGSGLWPLFHGTRNRKCIEVQDRCLIYLGGRGPYGRHFIGSAVVEKIDRQAKEWGKRESDLLTDPAADALVLGEVARFPVPVPIKTRLGELSFVGKSKFWGVYLQGGCRRISENDFQMVCKTGALVTAASGDQ